MPEYLICNLLADQSRGDALGVAVADNTTELAEIVKAQFGLSLEQVALVPESMFAQLERQGLTGLLKKGRALGKYNKRGKTTGANADGARFNEGDAVV